LFAGAVAASAGYADGEIASADTGQPLRPPVFSSLKINLAFQASQDGNAEIVFGKTNTVGELRLSGIRAVVGFDRGAWVIKGDRFSRTLGQAASTAAMSPHKMTIHVWLNSQGVPFRLHSFTIDGAPFALSPEERVEVLSFLDPREWDTFKTVTRGDASAVKADVSLYPVGGSIILR